MKRFYDRISRRRIRYWLGETQYDWMDWRLALRLPPGSVDAITGAQERWIEQPASQVLCRIWGHEPEMDQCMRPEHDYCICCRILLPGQAPQRKSAP